jgi:hypothetical protein
MTTHALKALRWYFMWRIKTAANGDVDTTDRTALQTLIEQRSEVVDELKELVKIRPADEVKVQVRAIITTPNVGDHAINRPVHIIHHH